MRWPAISLTLLTIIGCASPRAVERPPALRETFSEVHMGSRARIVIAGVDHATARAAARAAFDRIACLERTLSDWMIDSEVARVAQAVADEPGAIEVSEDLARALSCALVMWQVTDGRFDPALGALTTLWRRAKREGSLPSEAEIALARRATGADALRLEGRTLMINRPGVSLDFGAIGKGWAADEALMVLRAHGCGAALIDFGGDLVSGDAPLGESGWRVRIGTAGDVIRLPPGSAVATSGDAERSLDADGTRRSHLIAPDVGLGVIGIPEITVMVVPHDGTADHLSGACGPGAIADALATALGTSDQAARERLLRHRPEVTVWINDGLGTTRLSPSLGAAVDRAPRSDPALAP
ncbi:MAG: FAD:protein FMN transferase [Phycisphaeraceae bacterium]|nr:FAD:protein FMN transferase [Phycisphaeraceae bacterium]